MPRRSSPSGPSSRNTCWRRPGAERLAGDAQLGPGRAGSRRASSSRCVCAAIGTLRHRYGVRRSKYCTTTCATSPPHRTSSARDRHRVDVAAQRRRADDEPRALERARGARAPPPRGRSAPRRARAERMPTKTRTGSRGRPGIAPATKRWPSKSSPRTSESGPNETVGRYALGAGSRAAAAGGAGGSACTALTAAAPSAPAAAIGSQSNPTTRRRSGAAQPSSAAIPATRAPVPTSASSGPRESSRSSDRRRARAGDGQPRRRLAALEPPRELRDRALRRPPGRAAERRRARATPPAARAASRRISDGAKDPASASAAM